MHSVKFEITSTIYVKIAKTCRKIVELGLAAAVCERGLNKFSRDAFLYNTKGEIHILKFNKSKEPNELKLALKCFESALSINPHSYLAKLLASQIYLKGKAYDKSKEKLYSIIKTAPDDVAALKLLKEIKRREDLQHKKEIETESRQSAVLETEEVSIEETSSVNYKKLIKQLAVFKKVSGILSLFLIDKYGMVIKSFNKSGIEENLLSAISANIFRSSQSGMQKLDLGNFKNGMIMSPIGNFYLANVSGAILLILTNTNTNQKEVDETIDSFIALTVGE